MLSEYSEFIESLLFLTTSSNGIVFVLLTMFFSLDLVFRADLNLEEYFISWILMKVLSPFLLTLTVDISLDSD